MSSSQYRDERLALFREVTGVEDDGLALQALSRHNWDVQAAVQEFLTHGGPAGPGGTLYHPSAATATSTSPIPQPVPPANNSLLRSQTATSVHRRSVSPAVESEQKQDGSSSAAAGGPDDDDVGGSGAATQEREALLGGGPAPRQAQQPAHGGGGGAVETVLMLPIKAVSLALRVALFPVRFLLARSAGEPLSPTLAARLFIDGFERDYGRRRPSFVVGGFQQAVGQAIREGKGLAVYLHSPLHEDTPTFCNTTLTAETLVTFLDSNLVVWGGSICHADAYGTSQLLEASSYPFLALLSCQQRNIEVLDRMEGAMPEEQVMQRLSAAMARQQELMERQEAARRDRDERLRLQEEQNREYQEALEADRRREAALRAEAEKRAREEADERRRRAEEEDRARSEAMQRDALLREKRARLPPEPALGGGAMKLRLQFPSGAKVDRRFRPEDSLQLVADFIDLHVADAGPDGSDSRLVNYSLSANFPKRSFTDLSVTLQQAALHSADTIYITDLDA